MNAIPIQQGSMLTVYFGLALVFAVLAVLSSQYLPEKAHERKAIQYARIYLTLQSIWCVVFFLTITFSGEGRLWATISDALIFGSYTLTIPTFYTMANQPTPKRSWIMVILILTIAVPLTVVVPGYANKLHIGNVAAIVLVIENVRAIQCYTNTANNNAARMLARMGILFVSLFVMRSVFLLIDPKWSAWNEAYISFVIPLMCLTLTFLVIATMMLKAQGELEELALRDSLTGLRNRHALQQDFQTLSGLAKRQTGPFALVVCDLDHFKSVNDRYGHVVGDSVLVEFSDMFETLLRDSDVAARIGGEEFVLLLHNTNRENLAHICERLIDETRALKFSEVDDSLVVTTSIGGLVINNPNISFDTAFSMADKNLYKAKAAGRDQFVFTETDNA